MEEKKYITKHLNPADGEIYHFRDEEAKEKIAELEAKIEGLDGKSYEEMRKEIETLKKELEEMKGNNPESVSAQTEKIDNDQEMENFLEGYTNKQKLKDVVAGSVDEDGIVHY